mgnify:CR=1 FL=1
MSNKTYEPKPNTGSLFPNSYKEKDNHPDMKGKVLLGEDLIPYIEAGKEVQIAGWEKETRDGEVFYSLSVSTPYEKKEDGSKPKSTKAKKVSKPVEDDFEDEFEDDF